MQTITREKLEQASALMRDSDLDVWLIFDQETADGGDPVLSLILDHDLTWQSALLISRAGERVAIVGSFDAEPMLTSGGWTDVIPYVEGIGSSLVATLDRLIPESAAAPRIGANFSTNDPKADGLSHGMFLLLERYLRETRFEGRLVSAEEMASRFRSRKTPGEISRIRRAIAETDRLFEMLGHHARPGLSELDLYAFVQDLMDERRLGYSWDRRGDPIVNSGPDSMIGHGIPSADILIRPGHILHVDLGVRVDGYSSDIQRCWFVPEARNRGVPQDVRDALGAVNAAITAGAARLRPGIQGWQVDEAARAAILDAGYEEYKHASGHQVGRMAHDGGALLGPRWERYGNTPMLPLEEHQVFTLELGVLVPNRGYLGIEEMVRITADGCEWLTERQLEMAVLDA